ncbi:uncharacterized protein V2V93DRAFT_363497 [Kockiozyma suomiensis]|uniref:uncharacterized protein n=1 Tax=Kockiozyma suomiensis TaxID=1337062 RepID=UPI003342FE11
MTALALSLQRLLLAQFVHKEGDSSFPLISKSLSSHPLLRDSGLRPVTDKECEELYNSMLKAEGLERQPSTGIGADVEPSPSVITLTQLLYSRYRQELIQQVRQDEQDYRKYLLEIEEIGRGEWDTRLPDLEAMANQQTLGADDEDEEPHPQTNTSTAITTTTAAATASSTQDQAPAQTEEFVDAREDSTGLEDLEMKDIMDEMLTEDAKSLSTSQPVSVTSSQQIPASGSSMAVAPNESTISMPNTSIDDNSVPPTTSQLQPSSVSGVELTQEDLHLDQAALDSVSGSATSEKQADSEMLDAPPSSFPGAHQLLQRAGEDMERTISPDATDSDTPLHPIAAAQQDTTATRADENVEADEGDEKQENILPADSKRTESSTKSAAAEPEQEPSITSETQEKEPSSALEIADSDALEFTSDHEHAEVEEVAEQSSPTALKSEMDEDKEEVEEKPQTRRGRRRRGRTEEPEPQASPAPEPAPQKKVQGEEKAEEVEVEEEIEEEEEEEEEEEGEEAATSRSRKRKQLSSPPFEDKSSPATPQSTPASSTRAPNRKFQALVAPLLSNISSNRSASFFTNPVSENDAPNYHGLIYQPTDLRTIKTMVKDGRIQTSSELEREVMKMFANAVMYNSWDSDISEWSREMQMETETLIAVFRGAERRGLNGGSTPQPAAVPESKRRKKQ